MKFISIALPLLAGVAIAAPAVQDADTALVAREETLLFDRLVADLDKRHSVIVERESNDIHINLSGGLIRAVQDLLASLGDGLSDSVGGLLSSLAGSLGGGRNKREEALGGIIGTISQALTELAKTDKSLEAVAVEFAKVAHKLTAIADSR
ncbi:hypothetical protein G7Z17_g2981 [Cylindrodendrum hubeiense]|uniref:Uncharacterized protein n=1 Tax=Cylindrodendrum hubeiense TaxID=595255 RepID=A0A9P5HJS2_9HYPO|nr:hypothetical protein G7Z17_g2981 [Cylindrodendrum hubeiense]